ncbi:MAG: hypothetical protein PHZ09_08675, partial [Eubacteriales bacterium]|nr:hypothetical protein [Eubacteriales bacterium]
MFPVSLFFLAAAALSGDLAPNPSLVLTSLLSGGAAIIIINLNFYIPILFLFVFLGERASFLQLTGIAPATAVIIFINLKSNDGRARNKKDNKSGIISACVACLANGTVNFGIKLRQYHTP